MAIDVVQYRIDTAFPQGFRMSDPSAALRRIPKIDALAEMLESVGFDLEPRSIVVAAIRDEVADYREALRRGEGGVGDEAYFSSATFVEAVRRRVGRVLGRRHRSVINATGILLHTGLGRAPLSSDAIAAAADAGRYAIVEVNPTSGERDLREVRISQLLCEITGAEAATVVNNNAAAILVALRALAKGRDVITSRGELVEIGGGFRMPTVMEESGCRLVEVGSTNRTYARDYRSAIGPETAMLLKVHTSNFRVMGFTHEASIAELAELAHDHDIPFVYDLGAGLLREVDVTPLEEEPTVTRALLDGADVVTFSGDKLIGGPQAGMLVGKREYIDRMRGSALFRAVRPGKLDLAALEATLLAWRRESTGLPDLPLYRALSRPLDYLRETARTLALRLDAIDEVWAEVRETEGYLGSGSAPVKKFRGVAVAVRHARYGADRLLQALRRLDPPIFARIDDGRVMLELRALFDDQIDLLTERMIELFASIAAPRSARSAPQEGLDG